MTVEVASDVFEADLYCPACEGSFIDGNVCPTDGTRLVKLVAPVDALIGRDIDSRFTIVERLGQGGMGAVYRAIQHSVGRDVAIKVVHPNLASDPGVIKRFLREARLASRLNHANAVAVLDSGQTVDGLFYIAMELVSGRTLADVADAEGRFELRRLIRIGMQVCEALEAAHQLGVIHRDLKPSNIMLLDGGRDVVKVLDFGLAKSLAFGERSEVTGSNNLIGTPAYMPPERAVGGSGDARSDLYSLGCILYQLGAGTGPFASDDNRDLLTKQVLDAPKPMPDVPPAFAAVVARLLSKEPDARYQSALETFDALDDVLAELPALPRRLSTAPGIHAIDVEPPPPKRRRWPWIVGVAAAVVAIVAVVAAGGDDHAVTHAPSVVAPVVIVPVPTPPVIVPPPIVPPPTATTRPAPPTPSTRPAPHKKGPFPF